MGSRLSASQLLGSRGDQCRHCCHQSQPDPEGPCDREARAGGLLCHHERHRHRQQHQGWLQAPAGRQSQAKGQKGHQGRGTDRLGGNLIAKDHDQAKSQSGQGPHPGTDGEGGDDRGQDAQAGERGGRPRSKLETQLPRQQHQLDEQRTEQQGLEGSARGQELLARGSHHGWHGTEAPRLVTVQPLGA